MTVTTLTPPQIDLTRRMRVMVVDDSVIVRGLFARWVEAESDFEMAAALRNGREAIEKIEIVDPDVVILDIDMPEIDGISALPLLLKKKPGLAVIMASTLTRRNAEIGLKALALGAADCIAKPETTRDVATALPFRRELMEKVRALGLRAGGGARAAYSRHNLAQKRRCSITALSIVPSHPGDWAAAYSLRPFSVVPPRALMIGSSTGGPQALTRLLPRLVAVLDRAPIMITQHMPPTFTAILAQHLEREVGRPVREAVDHEEIMPGTIYVAPGGHHLRVMRSGTAICAMLDDGPQVNFCKPAVDPMFASGAAIWGASLLGVVLTGMGSDGMRGTQAIAAAGGSVIAQDERSSVIWGMPGQAAATGQCSAVLPLDEMGKKIASLFGVHA